MVGPDSTGISRAPAYSGDSIWSRLHFAYGALTLCGMLSQYISTSGSVCHSSSVLRDSPLCTLNPISATTAVLTLSWFRLFPFRSPLLGESLRFLFLGLLRCFTSPGSSRITRATGLLQPGCPIRRSPDHGMLASPRSFSQLAASFIG